MYIIFQQFIMHCRPHIKNRPKVNGREIFFGLRSHNEKISLCSLLLGTYLSISFVQFDYSQYVIILEHLICSSS